MGRSGLLGGSRFPLPQIAVALLVMVARAEESSKRSGCYFLVPASATLGRRRSATATRWFATAVAVNAGFDTNAGASALAVTVSRSIPKAEVRAAQMGAVAGARAGAYSGSLTRGSRRVLSGAGAIR